MSMIQAIELELSTNFFFDKAGLYALQISICSNNSRDEPVSNPDVPGTYHWLSNRAIYYMSTIYHMSKIRFTINYY